MNRVTRFFLMRHLPLYKLLLKATGRTQTNSEVVTFMECIGDGDVVLDVGANEGRYTTVFSHLVGKEGKVYAFEPVPPTFERLSREVTANKWFDNVVFNNLAVGDVTGPITLHMPDNDHGQASIMQQNMGSWEKVKKIAAYDCRICRMDDYLDENISVKPTFIKIDVEGAELLALKGAVKTLSQYQPLIYLEICYAWSKNFGYAPADIVSFLQTLGYSEFYLCSDSVRLLTDPPSELLPEKLPVSTNLLCTIPARHKAKIHSLSGA